MRDNGPLRWKEKCDAQHLRMALMDGCVCELCESARAATGQPLDLPALAEEIANELMNRGMLGAPTSMASRVIYQMLSRTR